MPTTIVIDGVTLTLKKYPEFPAGNPTATDITLFATPVAGDLFKTTMDNFIANVLHVDGATITGDGSSGNPLISSGGGATASEGLIAVASDVRLGDTSAPGASISVDRFIDVSGHKLVITGNDALFPAGNLQVNNTNGVGIEGITDAGIAIYGRATTGGNGVQGHSTGGIAGEFDSDSSANPALFAWNNNVSAAEIGVFAKAQNRTNDVFLVLANGALKLIPITATAASAITPAEGMMLFVSTTDATFTSIGFWAFENGAWHKL